MNHYINLERKFQIEKQVNVLIDYVKFTYNTWVSSDCATKCCSITACMRFQ